MDVTKVLHADGSKGSNWFLEKDEKCDLSVTFLLNLDINNINRLISRYANDSHDALVKIESVRNVFK